MKRQATPNAWNPPANLLEIRPGDSAVVTETARYHHAAPRLLNSPLDLLKLLRRALLPMSAQTLVDRLKRLHAGPRG